MTWNHIRSLLAGILAVGDDRDDEQAVARAAAEDACWSGVFDGQPACAWIAQAVLMRPAIVRARAAGFGIPGDEVATSMADLAGSSGGPPIIQHWALASSCVIRRYKFPNGDIYGFERAPLSKFGSPPVDVAADQWRYLEVVPVFPGDKPAPEPKATQAPVEPDRGDAYEGPDPEPPAPPNLKLLQGGDDPGDAPPEGAPDVDPDLLALMRDSGAPEAPAPAPALRSTAGPDDDGPVCVTHDMPHAVCGCPTMGEVLGVDPGDVFQASPSIGAENAAREANEALAAADRKRMVEALRGTRLTPGEIMDRTRLSLADLAGCVAVLIDGADPRDADIPPCAEFRMPLVGTQAALARRSPPGCGACGHPLLPHVPNARPVDRTIDPEDGTRPGAPGTRNDSHEGPKAEPAPPEPVAAPAGAAQVPPFRPDPPPGGPDAPGDVVRAGLGGGNTPGGVEPASPPGGADGGATAAPEVNPTQAAASSAAAGSVFGAPAGASSVPGEPAPAGAPSVTAEATTLGAGGSSSPGVAPADAPWRGYVSCAACGANAVQDGKPTREACDTCGAGDGAVAISSTAEGSPRHDWSRVLKRHGRDGVHVGEVVPCKVCAQPIGAGEQVRFLPRLPARRAHGTCLYQPVSWVADMGGAPMFEEDAPDPPMPPAPSPVDVGAPIAASTDPRDPCEWNPEANRETQAGDPWHNPAALLCGTGKAATRLCRACAALPVHAKKKARKPLGKGVAA